MLPRDVDQSHGAADGGQDEGTDDHESDLDATGDEDGSYEDEDADEARRDLHEDGLEVFLLYQPVNRCHEMKG